MGAAALLGLVEWVDLSIQLTPLFESFKERAAFTAYFSLNLVIATLVGIAVGICFYLLNRGRELCEQLLSGNRPHPGFWRRSLSAILVCGFAALLLNQQPTIHRYVKGVIREAEKLESLNQPLLNHERASSYIVLACIVAICWALAGIARKAQELTKPVLWAWSFLLIAGIATAYYLDSRVEVQLYDHSLHLTAFIAAMVLTMTLIGSSCTTAVRRWASGHRRGLIQAGTAATVLIAASAVFSSREFEHNQKLKTQVFFRSTQTRQYVNLIQWVLDYDRDGYSPLMGGGDGDDTRAAINPSAREVPGDGVDNNGIAGELSRAALEEWNSELAARRAMPDPSAQRLDVIYIFIDALRPDHLGAHGYHRNTSPNIDKLAARASLFENAYSPAPNTFEALPKFMQSNYWDGHLETWPEILERNGYTTLLFPRRITTLLRHVRGMKVVDEARVKPFAETIDKTIAVLGRQPPDRPVAAFLYSTDPHRPYVPYAQFPFGSSMIDLYDGEIANTDHQLGRLFDWLEESGRLSKTMIVIMADHGESFGERGVYKHSIQLYDDQLQVPMIIYHPAIAPRRVADYVTTVDLGATILNAVGLEYPPDYAGVSLVPLMKGEPFVHPPVYAEQTGQEFSPYVQLEQNVHPETKKYMVITQDGYKLIYNRNVNTFELYHLNRDPREERNLFDREAAKSAELWALLGRFIDIVTASRPPDADETQYRYGPSARGEE
jgi:arylsulfatase A-like enzyme